jgi:hypothetical protein
MKLKIASSLLILLFSLTIVFHLLILLKVIPYAIAWGGRLQNDSEMFVFEGVSIALNALFLFISITKYKQIKLGKSSKFINVMLWIIFALFALNTIGNLFSINSFEKMVFAPITIVLAIACFMLARNKVAKNDVN